MPTDLSTSDQPRTIAMTGRPLQRLSWKEKIAKEREWFKRNVEYYISLSNFNSDGTGGRKDIANLYRVYNNQFPKAWFAHVTDPLSAKNPNHKNFPAKVRPVTILRTNIDLLQGEYPRRPFVFQVVNMGEDGYNSYTEQLRLQVQNNLTQHFTAAVQAQAAQQGLAIDEMPPEEIELPEKLKERFTSNYRDAQAIRGQRWLNRAMTEYQVRTKFKDMFKDWLIAGKAFSYKALNHGNFHYERVSPLQLDYDKSPDIKMIEDGEWAVRRKMMTLSDITDRWYEQLRDQDHHDLESRGQYSSPLAFYQYLENNYNHDTYAGKIPTYHVVWKGKEQTQFLSYPDPETGEMQEDVVDEFYIPNKDRGETVEKRWTNIVYEGVRIGDNIFVDLQPVPVQRSEMNNHSACKLPYNGCNYSDVHAENISVLELGIPFQIMYIIVTRTLELTIAKSKGKILLIDKQAIPRTDGWDDEKFFYYSEALGYGLLNRNQIGVDKSWNQYQVLDMTLFESIKQLIELQNHFKQQWDDVLGISPPRKAQTTNSDGKAVNEMSIFQSSVITDMIYAGFEEFTQAELQGLLDYSKFVNINGVRRIFSNEDFDLMLLDIDPVKYTNADLGVFVSNSAQEYQNLMAAKAQTQAMIQNKVRASTVMEVQMATNIAELKTKLKRIEEIEMEMIRQGAEDEQQAAKELDERKMAFAAYQADLDAMLIDKEYDRKEQLEHVKGEYALYGFGGDGDNNDNGIPDANEIQKRMVDREKIGVTAQIEREKMALSERQDKRKADIAEKEMASNERIADTNAKASIAKARAKPKPKT